MIDSLGDVGAMLKYANLDDLERLYNKLDVQLEYEPTGRTVVASVSPRVVSASVRGELHTIHPATAGRRVEGYARCRGSRARSLYRTCAGALWSES